SPFEPKRLRPRVVPSALSRQGGPAAGRQAEAGGEMPSEMALVGKTGGRCSIGKGGALGDHLLRPGQPPADLIAVRRGAGGGAEMAGKREAVEARDRFQLLRGHG